MKDQKLEYQLMNFKKELSELGNESINELISLSINKLNKNMLEVAFIGRFAVGKSTLINALLKRDLLPSSTGVTTSKLSFIKKGNEEYLKVNYKNGNSSKEDLSKESIEKFSVKEDVIDFEIFLADFPFDNTVFVDTPGVEDVNNLREDITYGYLPTADIIVFILDIASILTKSELEFYKNHIASNYRDKVFLAFNKADLEDDNFSELGNKIEETLSGLEINQNNKFIVSARNCLAGEILNKKHLIDKSNINELNNAMTNYLLRVNISKIKENKILDYVERAKELSITQLKTSLESLNKDKKTLENELDKINQESLELNNKISDLDLQLNQTITNINSCIDTYFNGSIEEINEEFKYLDIEQKLDFIKKELPKKISSLIKNIRICTENKINTHVYLKEINPIEDVLYSFLNKLEDVISSLTNLIIKQINKDKKTNDDSIKEIVATLIRKVSSAFIEKRLDSVFTDIMKNLKNDLMQQIENSKNLIKAEIENGEKAELNTKRISIEKSISNLESDQRIFLGTEDSINKKIESIESLYFSILNSN